MLPTHAAYCCFPQRVRQSRMSLRRWELVHLLVTSLDYVTGERALRGTAQAVDYSWNYHQSELWVEVDKVIFLQRREEDSSVLDHRWYSLVLAEVRACRLYWPSICFREPDYTATSRRRRVDRRAAMKTAVFSSVDGLSELCPDGRAVRHPAVRQTCPADRPPEQNSDYPSECPTDSLPV